MVGEFILLCYYNSTDSIITVLTQYYSYIDTVLSKYLYSIVTVLTQYYHNNDTVLSQYLHSIIAILTQYCHGIITI